MKRWFQKLDHASTRLQLRLAPPRDSLTVFLFHAVFRGQEEIDLNVVDPQARITVQHLHDFVEYYLDCGCTFVSPDDVLAGLGPGRHILVTFDDGYFNNSGALPVLHAFDVPALFFVSTDHVLEGKCFWWDVLYRERLRSGSSPRAIEDEARALRGYRNNQIEHRLQALFGGRALHPICDVDRPFAPAELAAFARERGVFIGNHTASHQILTLCSREDARVQIARAQQVLCDITGARPRSISYPNGIYSGESVQAARESGLEMGITLDFRKHFLPLDPGSDTAMRLGRVILNGDERFMEQCETLRGDVWLFASVWHGVRRWSRAGGARPALDGGTGAA